MVKKKDKGVLTYINLEPTHAKDPRLRPKLEEDIKTELTTGVPEMVSRLAKLEPLISHEVGEYADFIMEADRAFMHGLWRGVIALVGIAAEGFTDSLYGQITHVRSATGEEIAKEKLFGRDDYMPRQRTLEVLRLFGLIDNGTYDKLVRIRKLRDMYVHPQVNGHDSERDAQECMTLFRVVLKERFDARYTIRQGKIVPRQEPDGT